MVPYEINDFISMVSNHLNSIMSNNHYKHCEIVQETKSFTKYCYICKRLTIIIKLKPNSSTINSVVFKSDAREELVKGIKLESYFCRKYSLLLTENIIPNSYHNLV